MRPFDATVPTGPLIDRSTLDLTPAWRAFLTALWARTGGAQGTPSGGWQQPLQLEATVRAQADQQLGAALAVEVAARSDRDTELSALIGSEVLNRQAADALLVPQSQLCSMWAACDLSFLPHADPGHGMPWLSDNVVCVGTSTSVTSGILLEDGTGDWTLEFGGAGNDWAWG